jgi:L-threonylcarbamoyladenylate synthase
MIEPSLRWLWMAAGCAALLLGGIGLFLPLLPTVPFVLLAAWCFSRGSRRWERWMLQHPRLGPIVRDWREHRAVPLRAKQLATAMMAVSSAIAAWWLPARVGWIPGACCLAVAVWLWRLPTRAAGSERQGAHATMPISPPAAAPVAIAMSTPVDALLEPALAALHRGEVIGLPTETVYGLAADASNASAVRRIFALKGRPADHPLIVHIASAEQLPRWASEIPETAWQLARAFWPGPLTLILRKQASVPAEVTGGQDTVGLRCPAHPLARELLQRFGGGLAAPSANRFGHLSPTRAQHVRDEFADAVPIVLDGGDSAIGIESTIVDLSGSEPRILRPGGISRAQIVAAIGGVQAGGDAHSPRVSGTLEAHYAPRTPMLLLPRRALEREAAQQQALGKRIAALALTALPPDCDGFAMPADPSDYAHELYASLRALDALGVHLLLVERPPESEAWLAVQDRLRRAAVGAHPDDDAP